MGKLSWTCISSIILILSAQSVYSQHGEDTTLNPTTSSNNTLSDTAQSTNLPTSGAASSSSSSSSTTINSDENNSNVESRELTSSSEDTTTVSPLPIVFSTSEEFLEDLSISDGLNDTLNNTPRKNVGIVTDDNIAVQTQIYIISGVFGAAIFILIIVVVILTLQISRLKDEIGGELERYVPAPARRQVMGYENGGFSRGAGYPEPGFNGGRTESTSSPYRSEMQERQNIEQFGMQERSVDRDTVADYSVYKGSREEKYKVTEEITENNTIPMSEIRGGSTGSPSTGGAQSRGAGGASSGGGGPIMNYSEGVIPLENGQTRNSP